MPMSKNVSSKNVGSVAAEEIRIGAAPIELSRFLKFAGVFESGGEAKHAIQGGGVRVDGVVEKVVRKQLAAGARVECAGRVLIVKV